jgi:hypothetical protein
MALKAALAQKAKTVTRRGHSKPPDELAHFIRLVNAERLFERELPDEGTLFAAMCKVRPPVSDRDYLDLLIRSRAETVAALSPEARAFLGPPEDPARPLLFSERWELLKSAGEVLSAIARRSRGELSGTAELLIFDRQFHGEFPFSVPVGVGINERGQGVLRKKNPLLDALIGAQLDHVRSCAVCGHIFWAKRANSECCGEQCRKTYNQRKSRANRKNQDRKRKGGER